MTRRQWLFGSTALALLAPIPSHALLGGFTDLLGSVLGSLNKLLSELESILGIAADVGLEFADAKALIDGFSRLADIMNRAQGLSWQLKRVLEQFDEIFSLAEAGNWFAAMGRSRAAFEQIRQAARTAVEISSQIQEDLQSRAIYASALVSLNKEPHIATAAAPLINNEWNALLFERLGHVTTLLSVTQRLIASEQAAIASAKERSAIQREAFLGQTLEQPLPPVTTHSTFGLSFR